MDEQTRIIIESEMDKLETGFIYPELCNRAVDIFKSNAVDIKNKKGTRNIVIALEAISKLQVGLYESKLEQFDLIDLCSDIYISLEVVASVCGLKIHEYNNSASMTTEYLIYQLSMLELELVKLLRRVNSNITRIELLYNQVLDSIHWLMFTECDGFEGVEKYHKMIVAKLRYYKKIYNKPNSIK